MNVIKYHGSHHTKKKELSAHPPLGKKLKNKHSSLVVSKKQVEENDSSSATDEDDSILVELGEKRVLVFCSVPIICIAVISVFHIIINHTPFFYFHCKAGSGEQLAMWTIIFILLVYSTTHFIYHFYRKSKAQGTVWASA